MSAPQPVPDPSIPMPAVNPADTAALAAAEALPSGEELLALERRAGRQGTGLEASDLEGLWLLERVWSRGQRQPSLVSSGVLRGLKASLWIEAEPAALKLTNSVRLGLLELRFQGPGWLRGRRPLLCFQFDRLELRVGERLLLQRPLATPEPRRQPFFALIATAADRGWLAARGRSGGLAVWRLSPTPPRCSQRCR